jgi:predicted dehydrogenase
VHNLLQKQAVGSIQLLRSTFGFPPLAKDNFRYQPELGGGALLDAGAYVVKATTLFLGKELEFLGASLQYDTDSRVDILGSAMFRNPSGQIAQLSFGFDYYYQCHYELLGTQGKLIVDRAFTPPPGFRPIIRLETQDLKQEFHLPADNHFVNMLNFLATIIQENQNFSVHWDDLLHQAKLLEMILQATS